MCFINDTLVPSQYWLQIYCLVIFFNPFLVFASPFNLYTYMMWLWPDYDNCQFGWMIIHCWLFCFFHCWKWSFFHQQSWILDLLVSVENRNWQFYWDHSNIDFTLKKAVSIYVKIWIIHIYHVFLLAYLYEFLSLKWFVPSC